jgi:acyl-CoA hydrolase
MDIQSLYAEKLGTPDELAGLVKSGMYIETDIALSAPPAILSAIDRRAQRGDITGAHVTSSLLLYPLSCYKDPNVASRLRPISAFSDALARKAVNAGIADVLPNSYSDCGAIIRDYRPLDVFAAMVSPMDKHGYFSFGCSTSVIPTMVEKASIILLEVNKNMPRAVNAPQIHIGDVTALCENDMPLPALPDSQPDKISATIGNFIAEEVPNGATIQLGVGGIPDAVGAALRDKHGLGIHTEMFTSSMVDLIECGAVDNLSKPINRGYSVISFALGSKKVYDYIDDNPMVKVLHADEVIDPYIIAQHPNFISINGALEVDFWGQVSAESMGTKHISGTGGQLDFVRGAIRSKGGKSFLAFASTAKNGTVSRIRPILTPGSIVSTGKNETDYIATEYGLAKIRGTTLSERTKALIAIAHPKFRDELTAAAKKENIII